MISPEDQVPPAAITSTSVLLRHKAVNMCKTRIHAVVVVAVLHVILHVHRLAQRMGQQFLRPWFKAVQSDWMPE